MKIVFPVILVHFRSLVPAMVELGGAWDVDAFPTACFLLGIDQNLPFGFELECLGIEFGTDNHMVNDRAVRRGKILPVLVNINSAIVVAE